MGAVIHAYEEYLQVPHFVDKMPYLVFREIREKLRPGVHRVVNPVIPVMVMNPVRLVLFDPEAEVREKQRFIGSEFDRQG
jgi:hypothetical protein